MNTNITKENKNWKGLAGTILFHVLLLGLLFAFRFAPAEYVFPDPEGITINFGNDDSGLGEIEPGPSPSSENTPISEPENETPTEQTNQTEESVLTQDYENTVAINEQKKAEELKKKQEEKKIAEEQQKKIKEKNDLAGKLFGKNDGDGSQGIDGGDGNQGSPDGDVNSKNYKGFGSGDGINWSLSGRGVLNLVQPNRGIQLEGKVVVEIIVDNNGNVVDARPGVQGSTTSEIKLWEAAQKAAFKTKFSIDSKAPPRQRGKITYIFELQ